MALGSRGPRSLFHAGTRTAGTTRVAPACSSASVATEVVLSGVLAQEGHSVVRAGAQGCQTIPVASDTGEYMTSIGPVRRMTAGKREFDSSIRQIVGPIIASIYLAPLFAVFIGAVLWITGEMLDNHSLAIVALWVLFAGFLGVLFTFYVLAARALGGLGEVFDLAFEPSRLFGFEASFITRGIAVSCIVVWSRLKGRSHGSKQTKGSSSDAAL